MSAALRERTPPAAHPRGAALVRSLLRWPAQAATAPGAKAAVEVGELVHLAALSADQARAALGSAPGGLAWDEAARRLASQGPNATRWSQPPSLAVELWQQTRNPLNALLAGLAGLSWWLGDLRASVVVLAMVGLAIALSFVQEHRASLASARLRALVKTTAAVLRRGRPAAGADATVEVPLETLVPGDLVRLSAGDMIPADVRLVETKDLYVDQSALTGEAMPVDKHDGPCTVAAGAPFDAGNLCFMGTNVVSGFATALVARTGARTFFGDLAGRADAARPATAFDVGVRRFTWMMIRVIGVMVPLVFVLNGTLRHDWWQSLMFAVAVGVGLAPEMLPMIVTVNLARGALAMSRLKVIVKRLDAIQGLGAMDVLCTDKTGTLTQNRIILKRHLDLRGDDSPRVLQLAWLNSHFQSGLRNLLDVAVLEHGELHEHFVVDGGYTRVDEIPFDFTRRRLSVVVAAPSGARLLVCKGAVDEVFAVCDRYEDRGVVAPLDAAERAAARAQVAALNEQGFRVVAIATREVAAQAGGYGVADERELVLLGTIAFIDPPKDSARAALAALAGRGISVKILTGDNDVVACAVCREVGLGVAHVLTGDQVEALSDAALAREAESCTVFARLTPLQKERVVRLLRGAGHVVGFLGDGINDSPALRAADVGISVDTAVDIARESADVILLENSLAVLEQGVVQGRRVFANITKYIRMSASSNFGNMLSVLGASVLLPFLPMTPIQVLTNNLLYDLSQTAIPTDNVDAAELDAPRRWEVGDLFRFMLVMGPISSLFDFCTFGLLLIAFDAGHSPGLFQSGWFVESVLTQALVIHVIRTSRRPFIDSRSSLPLALSTGFVCATAIALTFSPLGRVLGLQPLPPAYWPAVAALTLGYVVSASLVRRRLFRPAAGAPVAS